MKFHRSGSRKLIGWLLVSVLLWSCVKPPEVVDQGKIDRLDMVTVRSRAIADNMLDDSPDRMLVVYLPPGYDASERVYPVVYFFHGFAMSPLMIKSYTQDLDRHFATSPEDAFVLVAVDGSNSLSGSYWQNSAITGGWQDFAFEEAPAVIQDLYRVSSEPQQTALAGFSMGGRAVLKFALEHPDHYCAVYAASPPFTTADDPAAAAVARGETKLRADIAAYAPDAFMTDNRLDRSLLDASEITDYVRDVFDQTFGGKWMENTANRYASRARKPMEIRIEYGTWGLPVVQEAVGDLSKALTRNGIRHTVETFPGGHGLPAPIFADSVIPFLASAFRK